MKILKRCLCAAGLFLLLFSCGKDAYDFGAGEGSATFQLAADYTMSAVGTKAEGDLGLDINEFVLEIFNSSGIKFRKELYGDIKDQKIKMNKGSFTAKAYFGDSTATGFNAIYFAGKTNFTVQGESTVPVAIICKMANVKVAVQWGDILQREYTDYSVKIYREGKNGSLLFSKSETRSGYIPAGDIKMDITLVDAAGNERIYSPRAVACASNDFVTFTIDTKESAKEEVTVSFQLVTDTDNKTESVIIPASLVAKAAPSVETAGFTGNSVSLVEGVGVNGDLQLRITAPGFIEKCEMVSDSDFFPSNWPEKVDLLDAGKDVLDMVRSYGIAWSMERGMDKFGIIDLKELAKKIRVTGDNVNKLKFLIADVKGQTAEVECIFDVKEVTLAIKSVPDYDMWATKAYVELVTNADDPSVFTIESMNGGGSAVLATCQAKLVSRTGDVSRFEITGLTPGTAYHFRANYCKGFKYTEQVSGTTEASQQLVNGNMDTWSNAKFATYGANSIYRYYAGNSSSDKAWGTKNTLTMDGVEGGTSSGTSNQVTAYRWNSCTIPTSDAVSGNAAEIRTMALSRVGLGGTDVGSGFLWANKNIENAVKKNYRVYAGTLYTGAADVTASSETPDKRGISHASRPASLRFSYKYAPYNGDNCKVYAVLYNASGEAIAATDEFTANSAVGNYTELVLDFKYTKTNSKAASLFVMFQSGVNEGINEKWEYVKAVDGSYDANPWSLDTFVGSVLKIDNVTLNY